MTRFRTFIAFLPTALVLATTSPALSQSEFEGTFECPARAEKQIGLRFTVGDDGLVSGEIASADDWELLKSVRYLDGRLEGAFRAGEAESTFVLTLEEGVYRITLDKQPAVPMLRRGGVPAEFLESYQLDLLSLQFSFPKGWRLVEAPPDGLLLIPAGVNLADSSTIPQVFLVQTEFPTKPVGDLAGDDFATFIDARIAAIAEGIKRIGPPDHDRTLTGEEFVRFRYEGTTPNGHLGQIHAYARDVNGRLVVLLGMGTAEALKGRSLAAEAILSSFQLETSGRNPFPRGNRFADRRIGLAFFFPEQWEVDAAADGSLTIIPPDFDPSLNPPAQFYSVGAFPRDTVNIENADDPAFETMIRERLGSLTNLRRIGDVTKLEDAGFPTALQVWEGLTAGGSIPVRLRFYSVVTPKLVLTIVGVGRPALIDERDEILRKIVLSLHSIETEPVEIETNMPRGDEPSNDGPEPAPGGPARDGGSPRSGGSSPGGGGQGGGSGGGN